MGNMRFPRQSRAVAHMNGNPLRTQVPASARYAAPPAGFCVAFLMKPRERERGSNSFRFYNLAFLHAVKSSVRDDKLQFGERSSEILTRASSKPLYQLQNDIFISQWDGADSWKTKCLVAGRLACWLQEKMNIFLHRCQFVAKLPVSSDLRPDVTLQWRLLLLQLGVMVNFWWPVMPVYRYPGVFDIAV